MNQQQEYDYIIIGGGSAGSVLAARLSEDPAVTVALLETGGDGRDWIIRTPAAAVSMIPTKINNYSFETVPQVGLNGRRGYQPRGRALGGSSAINAMVYVCGDRSDYDHWASLGNTGWSYADVLPYFKRAENNERIYDEFHGQGGPLNVADLRTDNPFQQHFLDAAKQAGFPLNTDFNGATQEGAGIYQVTQIKGERCSVARAYLHPHMNGARPNLHVLTHTQAREIVIENKRATGVKILQHGRPTTLKAKREVLCCAGAIHSPQLLMLSGVGDQRELVAQGIPVAHHLPGVGKNLQDHPDFIFGFAVKSLDLIGFTMTGMWHMLCEFVRYLRHRRGMMATNFAEGGAFLKLTPTSIAPDIQLHFVIALVDDHARKLNYRHGLSCHVCLLRPKSRGTIALASRNPDDAPLIDPAFLLDEDDVVQMVAGFKRAKKLLMCPALASRFVEDLFTKGVTTDDDIRRVLRERVDTVYHPVGSCKMGNDNMAVVDHTLKVHGIAALRVVDASIMPTLIGGNTNAPTIMIAEKAAEMIRREAREQQGR
ncbi:MAG: GMC family oxidoreductase N-terminal domain-containing protein [Pseudomonadota bacterium]